MEDAAGDSGGTYSYIDQIGCASLSFLVVWSRSIILPVLTPYNPFPHSPISPQSITIVNEQRLLPLKAAGLAPAPLSSPSCLDDRMRIDADLPTKDCPPTGHHLQAQANAARLDRDIIEHLRENFAPSSFLESEVNAQYKEEIEQGSSDSD